MARRSFPSGLLAQVLPRATFALSSLVALDVYDTAVEAAIIMILARTLFSFGKSNQSDPSGQSLNLIGCVAFLRWFSFALGCGVGGLIMTLYSWLLEKIYALSGNSLSFAVVCVLVITVVDALLGPIASPSTRLQESAIGQRLPLQIIYIITLSLSIRYYGPVNTQRCLSVLVGTGLYTSLL